MANKLVISAVFRGVDKMSRVISGVHRRMRAFTSATARGLLATRGIIKKVRHAIGAGLQKAFKVASVAAVGFGAVLGKVVDIGADFEKTLVAAIVKFPGQIRKGSEAYAGIEEAVLQVGKTTEFSASQSAQALNYLAMAGFTAEQAVAALPGVVNLATTAQIELGEATDIATDTLGAMGLATKDATQLQLNLARVSDVMAATTTSANTNMQDMFEAIKEGGPVAVTAGLQIEDYASLVGELANAGIKGGRAGTTLKNVLVRLKEIPKNLAGVKIKDAKNNFLNIFDILKQVEAKTAKMGTAKKSAVLEAIFGRIPLAGVNVLLQSGGEKLQQLADGYRAVGGATKEMSSVMRDTTAGSIANLKSAVEGVIISLFKMEDKGIRGVIDSVTEWIRANEGLIVSEIQDFLKSFRENLSEIISAFKALGVTIAIIYALSTAIGVLNFVMMANPIVLIVGVIVAAVAAAAILIYTYWDDIVLGYQSMVDKFEAGIGAVVDFFSGLGDKIKGIWSSIVDFILGGISNILTAIFPVGGLLKPIVKAASYLFGGSDKSTEEDRERLAAARDESRTVHTRGFHPTLVTPSERTVAALEERKLTTTHKTEVTLKDETGKARVTKGTMGPGVQLLKTGSFN